MNFSKTIKYILLIVCIVFFFPSYNGSIFTFGLKIFLYVFLMYICYAVINDGVNYIAKNWGKMHLLWIDEREHAKDKTLANLSRLGIVGGTFRLFHYINFNKRRVLQEMWYNYLDNIAVTITIISIILIVIGFLLFRLAF